MDQVKFYMGFGFALLQQCPVACMAQIILYYDVSFVVC